MSSTPFTCCSIGVVTDCSTTSALAPGYVAWTTTWGGVISGYWAMGRNGIATASTESKIGRSMKYATIDPSASGALRGGRGRDPHARTHLLQPRDDHLLAGGQAFLDHPHRLHARAHAHA